MGEPAQSAHSLSPSLIFFCLSVHACVCVCVRACAHQAQQQLRRRRATIQPYEPYQIFSEDTPLSLLEPMPDKVAEQTLTPEYINYRIDSKVLESERERECVCVSVSVSVSVCVCV